MLRQVPYITVYIYKERVVIMQVLWGLTAKCFGGNKNCDKISAVFSTVNRTIKTEVQKIYDLLWLWSKMVHFLWLFMAIKFELSLVITFMAFYDCVRTLHAVCQIYHIVIIVPKY